MKHKIGDQIYIPSSFYIDHGEDDVQGGLATIEKFIFSDYLPEDHINSIFVTFEEIETAQYNYKVLLQKQDELKKEFRDRKAYNDPDFN